MPASSAMTRASPPCAPRSRAIERAGFRRRGAAVPAVRDRRRWTSGSPAAGSRAALHEAAAASPAPGDDAAATLFLAALAARFARGAAAGGQVLWALARRDLFAPGLAQAGLTPERLLYAECRNDEEVLAVMEEGRAPRQPRRGGRRGRPRRRWPRPAGSSSPPRKAARAALLLRRWRKAGRRSARRRRRPRSPAGGSAARPPRRLPPRGDRPRPLAGRARPPARRPAS